MTPGLRTLNEEAMLKSVFEFVRTAADALKRLRSPDKEQGLAGWGWGAVGNRGEENVLVKIGVGQEGWGWPGRRRFREYQEIRNGNK